MAKATEGSDLEEKCDQYESILNESILTDAKSKATEEEIKLKGEKKLAKKAGKVQGLKKELEYANLKLAEIDKNLRHKNSAVQSIKQNLSFSDQKIQTELNEKAQLTIEKGVITMEIKEIAKYDRNNQISKKMEALMAKYSYLEKEKEKIKLENNDLKIANNSLRKNIESLTKDQEVNKEEIERILSIGMKNNSKIEQNKQKIKKIRKTEKNLKDDNRELLEQVSTLTSQMEEKDQKIEELEALLKEKDKIIQSLEVENKELREELERKNNDFENLKKEKKELEDKIKTMENKIPNGEQSVIKNVVDLTNVYNDELNISKSISKIRSKYYDSELHQREKENIQNFDKQDSVILHYEQELNGSSISDKNQNLVLKQSSDSINSGCTDNLLEDVDYEISSARNPERRITYDKSSVAEVDKHSKKIEQNSVSQKEGAGQKDCIEGLQVVDYEDEDVVVNEIDAQKKQINQIYDVLITDNNASRILPQQKRTQINQKQSIFTPSVEQKLMNYNAKPITYQKVKENGVEKYGVMLYDTNKRSEYEISSKKLLDNQKEQHVLDENTANVNQLKLKNFKQPEKMKYNFLQTNVVDCSDNVKDNKRIIFGEPFEQSSNDNININELDKLINNDEVCGAISEQNRPKTGNAGKLQSDSSDQNIFFQRRRSLSSARGIGDIYVNSSSEFYGGQDGNQRNNKIEKLQDKAKTRHNDCLLKDTIGIY